MSDYTVDVNNPAEPQDGRDAWKMAAEMRALKQKMVDVIGAATIPSGTISMAARTSEPSGWKIIPPSFTAQSYHVGGPTSGASYLKGNEYQNLFNALWTDPGLQLFSVALAPISRGASAASDWAAGASISLPPIAGRVVGAVSTTPSHPSGSMVGEETHTLTVGEMPAHTHQLDVGGGGTNDLGTRNGNQNNEIVIGQQTTTSQGSGQAHNIMQPTYFMNYFVKL